MKYRRVDRVKELMKREISKIIQFDIKNIDLGFITVTAVEMNNDLRFARVFVSIFSQNKEKKEIIKTLTALTGFIKGKIGKRIRLKFMPEIDFKLDDTIEQAQKIDEILEKIKSGQC